LIHFSTDYVFDGKKGKPYIEEDGPCPLNIYGASKLAGEYFIQGICSKKIIIRTSGLFGTTGCAGKGNNFIDTMISLEEKGKNIQVVNDQYVSPTSTFELAQKVKELIERGFFGLYHLTNEGECTWFELACEIFSLLKKNVHINPVTTKEYGSKAQRPLYSVLENKKANSVGITKFSHWKDALCTYLHQKGYLS
jgi:dTDP-4-dehydrorhamnose reductase